MLPFALHVQSLLYELKFSVAHFSLLKPLYVHLALYGLGEQ